MCLAIPARILKILPEQRAIIDLAGVHKEISTALLDSVAIDDYVILHVGFAIGKIDPDEAQRTLQIFSELSASQEINAGQLQ